jgi:hypothetical protein
MRCHDRDFNTRKSTLFSFSQSCIGQAFEFAHLYIDEEAAPKWIKKVVPAVDVLEQGVCLRDRFLIFNNAFAERRNFKAVV